MSLGVQGPKSKVQSPKPGSGRIWSQMLADGRRWSQMLADSLAFLYRLDRVARGGFGLVRLSWVELGLVRFSWLAGVVRGWWGVSESANQRISELGRVGFVCAVKGGLKA